MLLLLLLLLTVRLIQPWPAPKSLRAACAAGASCRVSEQEDCMHATHAQLMSSGFVGTWEWVVTCPRAREDVGPAPTADCKTANQLLLLLRQRQQRRRRTRVQTTLQGHLQLRRLMIAGLQVKASDGYGVQVNVNEARGSMRHIEGDENNRLPVVLCAAAAALRPRQRGRRIHADAFVLREQE